MDKKRKQVGLNRATLNSQVEVFQKNVEALLLSPPLGALAVLGIDPGIRTGCKCAMVNKQGALVDYKTLFL